MRALRDEVADERPVRAFVLEIDLVGVSWVGVYKAEGVGGGQGIMDQVSTFHGFVIVMFSIDFPPGGPMP